MEDYWSGGQLLRKGRYVNGKRDGYWEVYHPSGQLHMKGHFVNGEFIKEKEQTELTMDEIAAKFGIPVNQLKIKKINNMEKQNRAFTSWFITDKWYLSDLCMDEIIDIYCHTVNPEFDYLDMALDCYKHSDSSAWDELSEMERTIAYELDCMIFAIFRRFTAEQHTAYRLAVQSIQSETFA